MTILSHQTIAARCKDDPPLVEDADNDQIRSASYDLRLGDQFYLSSVSHMQGVLEIQRLYEGRHTLEVPPNQVVLVRTLEKIHMPNNMVGHLSLKLDVLLKGIIMASQSQIDAGYNGSIYALLYNLSDLPVTLSLGQSLLRLEFAKLDRGTDKPYAGDYRYEHSLVDVVRTRVASSLEAMNQRVMETRRTAWAVLIGSVVAVATLLVTVAVPYVQSAEVARGRAEDARREVDHLKAESVSTKDALEGRIAALERQLATLLSHTPGTVPP